MSNQEISFKDLGHTDKRKLQVILKNYIESQSEIKKLKQQIETQQNLYSDQIVQLKQQLGMLNRKVTSQSKCNNNLNETITEMQKSAVIHQAQVVEKPIQTQKATKTVKPPQVTKQNVTKQQSDKHEKQSTNQLQPTQQNEPLQLSTCNSINNLKNIQQQMQAIYMNQQQSEQKNQIKNLVANPYQNNRDSSIISQATYQAIDQQIEPQRTPNSMYEQSECIRQISGKQDILEIINNTLPRFDQESFTCTHENQQFKEDQQKLDQKVKEIEMQVKQDRDKTPGYMYLIEQKQKYQTQQNLSFNKEVVEDVAEIQQKILQPSQKSHKAQSSYLEDNYQHKQQNEQSNFVKINDNYDQISTNNKIKQNQQLQKQIKDEQLQTQYDQLLQQKLEIEISKCKDEKNQKVSPLIDNNVQIQNQFTRSKKSNNSRLDDELPVNSAILDLKKQNSSNTNNQQETIRKQEQSTNDYYDNYLKAKLNQNMRQSDTSVINQLNNIQNLQTANLHDETQQNNEQPTKFKTKSNDLFSSRFLQNSQTLKVSEAKLYDEQVVKYDDRLKIQKDKVKQSLGKVDVEEIDDVLNLLNSVNL